MNNFAEDESSIYPITILNIDDKNTGWQKKVNYENASLHFYPESGIFLEGVSNTIGLHIKDCSGLGIPLENIEVIDKEGNVIANTATNQFGYGRFEIYNATLQPYRLRYNINGENHEKALPLAVATGVAFSVNNYVNPDKVAIKVKTNNATLPGLKGNVLTLVLQQNESATLADIQFGPGMLEQTIIIPRSDILNGFNTIYLVDATLKLLGQRIIYDPKHTPPKSVLNIIGKSTDSIKITGASGIKMGVLSMSVLPAGAVSPKPAKSIQSALLFDNYMSEPMTNMDYYLTDFNRKKHYELDHALLSIKPKYEWERIMSGPPAQKYGTDYGLAIQGTLNTANNRGSIHKINMKSSALGFDEFTSMDAKNEFVFKNLLAIDSARIYFLPKDKTGKILPHRLSFRIVDNNRQFIKSFTPSVKSCEAKAQYEQTLPFPKVVNSILLDSISIVAKNSKLKYRNRLGNMNARSFKIAESDAHKSLLGFIGANGFTVSRNQGTISITSHMSGYGDLMRTTMNRRTFLNGQGQTMQTSGTMTGTIADQYRNPGPVIFIDDIMVPNYDMLDNYSMSNIDEIYMNKNSNDISVLGSNGIIKIYTKREFIASPNGSPSIIIKNGFQKYTPFQNPAYDDLRDEGFQKLGTIFWNPLIETDEKGTFKFSIPNFYQKSVYVIIEGLDAEGTMISELHLLETK